jgi:hypothetical protein
LWHSIESSVHLAKCNQIRCKQIQKRLSTRVLKLPFYTACFVCCLASAVRVLESATDAPRLSYRVYFHLPGEGGKKTPLKFKKPIFLYRPDPWLSIFFWKFHKNPLPFPITGSLPVLSRKFCVSELIGNRRFSD